MATNNPQLLSPSSRGNRYYWERKKDPSDAYILVDAGGHVVQMNPAAERLSGWSARKAIGEDISKVLRLIDTESGDLVWLPISEVLTDGQALQLARPLEFVSRTGDAVPVVGNLSLQKGDGGGVTGVACIFRSTLEDQRGRAAERNLASQTVRIQQALLRLTNEESMDLQRVFRLVVEECARTLATARVSIWIFDKNRDSLVCKDLYSASTDTHEEGAVLESGRYPRYLKAIYSYSSIVANDACTHPDTKEFTDHYLKPLGISSMMDVPLRVAGELIGVLCCEHVGARRNWNAQEVKFAVSLAGSVIFAIERAQRCLAENEIRQINATLEERIHARTAELQEREELLHLMVEEVQDFAILRLDVKGNVTSWNAGARHAKGYEAGEIIGRHISCFYLPADVEAGKPDALLKRAAEVGRAVDEGWRVRKDGSRFWAEVAIAAVRQKDGKLRGYTEVTHDVTERKRARETLEAALRQEKELTRKALAGERAKSEFLGVISHEIRTPMNAVLGFAELLLRMSELPPSCREYVRTILSSGESLLRILDDILDFSQVDSGRLQIVESDFSPKEMLSDIHALFNQRALEKGISFSVRVAKGVPNVLRGDAGRLRQILLNLTGNAVKFTNKGSISIVLRQIGNNPLAASPKFEFRVADTGAGISPEKQEHIFDPFTQEDSSISRRYGGAGLGLAISRRLAHCLGGTLTVESKLDVGSLFSLRIPLRYTDSKMLLPEVFSPDIMDENFARRHPLRIMIVEDDNVNLRLLQALIRKLGYEPILAQNGGEAIRLYQKYPVDFLLMDLQMPEVDGMEATKMIRTLEKDGGHRVFISALTANIFPADRKECFAVGMDEYLNKPVKLISLAQVVRKACAFRRTR